jgi:hypothetical protein
MPRQARIDAPGALHHIMVRGIEQQAIFRDDRDPYDYLSRIGEIRDIHSLLCLVFDDQSHPFSHQYR